MNAINKFPYAKRILIVACFLLFAMSKVNAQQFEFGFQNYTGDHLWSNSDNWIGGLKPIDETSMVLIHDDVIVDENVDILQLCDATICNLTIQSGNILTVRESISWSEGGDFIVEDGAQLIHQNSHLEAKVLKKIKAYNADTHQWNLISSPIIEDIEPTTENGILTEPESGYALYTYNEENCRWVNYKEEPFTLINGGGYLYANALDTTIVFSGLTRGCATPVEVCLSYHANNGNLTGYNSVGNPLPCNAFANKSYYILNESSNSAIAVALSSGTPIPPCTGIFVKAKEVEDIVTFSNKKQPSSENQGYINIIVTDSDTQNLVLDQALISFNPNDNLTKFHFFEDSPQVFFTKDSQDFAIISIDSVDMQPFKFKATENGSYTIHFELKNLNLNYLHLIDNITGANIDLLSTTNYTFNANTSDYVSRFKLVFDPHYSIEEDDLSTNSEVFAYYANGNIIINDVKTCYGASLHIVDMTGKTVWSETINNRDGEYTVSTRLIPGIYILHFTTKHGIRTQKMVIE